MQADNTALFVAFIALVATVIAPVIAGWFTLRADRNERWEVRRKAQEDHWRELGLSLVEIRAQLQYLHYPPHSDNDPEKEQQRETLYGKAYGIMLLSGDNRTQAIAEKVMSEPPGDPKLQVINEAIRNFAKRADEVMKENSQL